MEFTAYHGCLESERRDGNLFVVDFSAEYDIRDAVAVYEIIAKEMAVPSNLLENVAGRIVKSLDIAFPCLGSFSVRVSKRNPPVSGPVQWSRVTISHRKQK